MPSSSFILNVGTVILSSLSSNVLGQSYSYTLQDTFSGSNFFNNFNFYTGADPTNGFVDYVDSATATSNNLIGFASGNPKWGVDTTNVISNTSTGRQSVRLEGMKNYNHGLFIADIQHMPGSICGVWPAFWTLGDGTWPAHGEMDIIEGVNQNSADQFTAHTGDNCTMAFNGQTGPALSKDCSLSGGGASGCAVGSSKANDYGTNFNSNGGGVYVMQWTSLFIKLWFFPRGSIPASITAGTPDYTTFGTPQANFDGTSCNIDTHFVNHRIVFDTTFCGDWAGAVYSTSSCPLASSAANGCVNYVANNPTAFTEAYWQVNYVKVFSETVVSATSSVSSSASTVSTTTTSSSSSSSTVLTISTSASTSKSASTSLSTSTTPSAATSTSKSASTSLSTSTTPSAATSTSKLTSTSSITTSVKPTSTTTSSSTSSTPKTSTSTSSSATATATATSAACPAANGQIYVLNSKRYLVECNIDHPGGDLKTVTVNTSGDLASCIRACASTSGCIDVSLVGNYCYLKSALTASTVRSGCNGAKLLG